MISKVSLLKFLLILFRDVAHVFAHDLALIFAASAVATTVFNVAVRNEIRMVEV